MDIDPVCGTAVSQDDVPGESEYQGKPCTSARLPARNASTPTPRAT